MDDSSLPDEQTYAEFRRATRDGRIWTYKLTVIQQPEKCRACGCGAKASADRRPVDPPPVVELRIFEGMNAEHDITFLINANYFLFATLEHHVDEHDDDDDETYPDRNPIKPPVLTGTPVSGLVYLDRPIPAGYFLFPDLAVRYEGKYVLDFNLYEELKNVNDEDYEISRSSGNDSDGPGHVTHRLSVKSKDFTVYSAKKFPGLNQSTELSRTVAEQGCRVRIRRDQRIRKKTDKIEQDTEENDEKINTDKADPASSTAQEPKPASSTSTDSPGTILSGTNHQSIDQNLAGLSAYAQNPSLQRTFTPQHHNVPSQQHLTQSNNGPVYTPVPSNAINPMVQQFPRQGQTYDRQPQNHQVMQSPSALAYGYRTSDGYFPESPIVSRPQQIRYDSMDHWPPPQRHRYHDHHGCSESPQYDAVAGAQSDIYRPFFLTEQVNFRPPPFDLYGTSDSLYASPVHREVSHFPSNVQHHNAVTPRPAPPRMSLSANEVPRAVTCASPAHSEPTASLPTVFTPHKPVRVYNDSHSTGSKRDRGQAFDTSNMRGNVQAPPMTSHDVLPAQNKQTFGGLGTPFSPDIAALRALNVMYRRADGRKMVKRFSFDQQKRQHEQEHQHEE